MDSLCIGVSSRIIDPSVFVERTHLVLSVLLTNRMDEMNKNSTCLNKGEYMSTDDYLVSNQNSICLCSKAVPRRSMQQQLIINLFYHSIKIFRHFSQYLFISFKLSLAFHWKLEEKTVSRSSTFQTIHPDQDLVTIYWSKPFHLGFIELPEKIYYLTIVQKMYNESAVIEKKIKSSDRCLNISELFNHTFLQWHLIRRIKYYHLPCQNQSLNLSCFHDETHFCLCYEFHGKRLANCFLFDHNLTYNCGGRSECENDGQCLQDDSECPTRSMCICKPCFYGRRCQFSTSGFGLSLDAILGYQILPNNSFSSQLLIIRISLGMTIICMIIGLINGVLSLITFKNKSICEVGCGLYLLGSSITTILIVIMFGLKFLLLLLTQMTIITDERFFTVQCYSLDFLIRICLCLDQWLNSCVACERAITTIKGARFVKKKSKQAAKLVIVFLLIVIIGTSIHDPLSRHMVEEKNDEDEYYEKRTWCIDRYGPVLKIYNYIIHVLHFVGPFLINLISSIFLITTKARRQLKLHQNRSCKDVLREQFQQHKHLLTAPIVLVILALPRLILMFISKCMKTSNDAWLFLLGYFISFIPPMLTFVIFLLPSKFYKKEFRKTIQQYRTILRRRLHLMS